MTKRISWSEPYKFVKAKRAEYGYGGMRAHIFLFIFCLMIFSALGIFIGENRDLIVVLIVSLIGSLLLVFPGLWIFSFIPNGITANNKGIVSGKSLIPYKKIKSAIVGHAEFQKQTFPVLVFTTTDNVQYMYGLSEKISPKDLSDYLESYGVAVQ
ncbi:hypothetical protein [Microbulbifer elongatus]|uniref:hypothetical protein n=1 Tax=Microbulbifer elongatus TaxID=86173 RepID=UPI001CFD1F62|nr:hypothetical protein [Microbulbifer elongatus]